LNPLAMGISYSVFESRKSGVVLKTTDNDIRLPNI
jgi:hypothetical protein